MAEPQPRKKRGLLRMAIFAAVTIGVIVAVRISGVTDGIDSETIRATVGRFGPWAYVVFVVLFTLAELVQIPGTLFVVAGIPAFGLVRGGAISLVAAMVAVSVSFFVARGTAGGALHEIENRWMKKMLATLDAHPVRTVILLRLVFWFAPPLNYALAFTKVRFRDYALGSLFGLVLPLAGISLATHYVLF